MTSKKEAVLYALAGVALKYNKGYCYPSQAHIMYLVKKWHKISMSRSTLNRILDQMEDEGWFERVRRLRKGPNGKPLFATTLYKLKAKVFKYLGSLREWLGKFFLRFRVPFVGQHKPPKSEILGGGIGGEGVLGVLLSEEGRASPSEGIF